MTEADPHNLNRFVLAQEGVYARVVNELTDGRKQSHWIWFIFPQVEGLGFSSTSRRYAIKSREEGEQYLRHDLLRGRLEECTGLVLQHRNKPISQIMVYPDDLKFRSSMTLFSAVSESGEPYRTAIDVFYGGKPDDATSNILKKWEKAGGQR